MFLEEYHLSLISTLVNKYDTPLVAYFEKELIQKTKLLQCALPSPAKLIYSVKANPNPILLQIFSNEGILFEAASTGELSLLLRSGIDADRILLGGPVKHKDGISNGLSAGILAFNVESITDLLRIQEYAKQLKRQAKVMLRVNPTKLSNQAVLRMGGVSSQFGIDEEQLSEVITRCSNETRYAGLFMYAGSQYFDASQIVKNTLYLCRLAKKERKRGSPPVTMLDFGGGFGVPEDESQHSLDLQLLYTGLKSVFDEELPDLIGDGLERVFFESGRFLTATSALFVTRIMDIKKSRGTRFIIVDGGINNLGIRQMLYRAFEPQITVLGYESTTEGEVCIIVGPTCTPIDIVHRGIKLPDVKIGDLLLIQDCGAYLLSYSPINFCGHPTPAEVLVEEDATYSLIRERGSLEHACGTGYTATRLRV